jgi:hypothetical protein
VDVGMRQPVAQQRKIDEQEQHSKGHGGPL